MKIIGKSIFRAIHEGKWLSIIYKNKFEETTRYWIAIKDIDLKYMSLIVKGFHLGIYQQKELRIYIDSIVNAEVLEGSYFEINESLVKDISINPEKYSKIFKSITNLKILNYLEDCYKSDTIPYITDFSLIKSIDRSTLVSSSYSLTNTQFEEIIHNFEYVAKKYQNSKKLNVLAI